MSLEEDLAETRAALVDDAQKELVGDDRKDNNPGKGRCGRCSPCLITDCGMCTHCLDKFKFGGPGTKRQRCKHKGPCQHPTGFKSSKGEEVGGTGAGRRWTPEATLLVHTPFSSSQAPRVKRLLSQKNPAAAYERERKRKQQMILEEDLAETRVTVAAVAKEEDVRNNWWGTTQRRVRADLG